MHAPQIVLGSLYLINLGLALGKHGQPKSENWSFWWTLTSVSLIAAILWWGGFWS